MIWVLPLAAAGAAAVAAAVRGYRVKLERDEEHRTRRAKIAARERIKAIKIREKLERELAAKRALQRRASAEAAYVKTARALLRRQLTGIENRAKKRIRQLDRFLASATDLRGEKAVAWIQSRKAKKLPRDDIRLLEEAFREFEVQLGRREYEKLRLQELAASCAALYERTEDQKTRQALDRLAKTVPDEAGYGEVPAELPVRYGFCSGKWSGAGRGRHFALPLGFRGELSAGEAASAHLRVGAARELYVNHVDYAHRVCRVSVSKAELWRILEAAPQSAAFDAFVEKVEEPGARIMVHGVRCFMPRSRLNSTVQLGADIRVRFVEFDRYLKSPVVVPEQAF